MRLPDKMADWTKAIEMILARIKVLRSSVSTEKTQKDDQVGSASVEFMFAFLLLLWMCLGFIDVVFQGYNGLLIDYGSYVGSRGYIVDEPGGTHWSEGAETVALGTMMNSQILSYRSGDDVVLEVTNKEMLRSGIIYGQKRKGTISIGNNLGEQEDAFSGDNAP